MFDGWQISMLMVLMMMMMAMAMSKKQNTSLPLFLCCAASTPEPGAGVTWASSRVLSRAKRLRSGLGSVGEQEWNGIT